MPTIGLFSASSSHRLDEGLAREQREASVAITRQSAKSVGHFFFLSLRWALKEPAELLSMLDYSDDAAVCRISARVLTIMSAC
jgi:hypothetical protein